MSSEDRQDVHADVAGYAMDALEADEQARFERHLAECPDCRRELDLLREIAVPLRDVGPLPAPPEALRDRTLAAVREAGAKAHTLPQPRAAPASRAPRRRWIPRVALAGAGACAIALAVLAGMWIDDDGDDPAEPEITAVLTGDGTARAQATVVELGIGREISLRTDDLPQLDNEAEFYELWFVGRGDSATRPNRVSAGTFHPDEAGRTDVRLTVAAVPADYPRLSVTREPRDGDPRRTGPEVLVEASRNGGA